MAKQANLRGVPLSLLTALSSNGYEHMAMDMIGYLKLVASTSFEKLFNIVVLLSNTLLRYDTLIKKYTTNPAFNAKLYLLLETQDDVNMVLLKDEKTLNERFDNIKTVYGELQEMVNENTSHVLPDCDSMKRYCRYYWRIVQW